MRSINWKPEQRLQWWKVTFGVVAFFVFLGIVGTMDYYAELGDFCERNGKIADYKNNKCTVPCEKGVSK